MKNFFTYIITGLLAFTSVNLNAQLKLVKDGKVGIGTDTPVEKLHINGSVRGDQNGALRINTGNSANGYIDIGPLNSSFTHFRTGLSRYHFDRTIILNNGTISSYSASNLILGTGHSSPIPRLEINSSTGNVRIGSNQQFTYKLNVDGDIASRGILISSDIRLKENIKSVNPALAKIGNLNPISFNYRLNPIQIKDSTGFVMLENDVSKAKLQSTKFGFSAQEVQKIFPELVSSDENGYLSVDYIGLIPLLVEALKEQQAKIEALEKKIQDLSRGKISF